MSFLSIEQIGSFLPAAVVLTLAPGPDIMMVLSLSLSRGRREGIGFGLGCAAACIIQSIGVAIGVAALIRATPELFFGLKIIGSLYLTWLGVQAIRSTFKSGTAETLFLPSGNLKKLFLRGMLANLTNPKIILFFVSFFPLYILSEEGGTGFQTLQLGVLFTLQAALIFTCCGWFAGGVGQLFARHPSVPKWLDRAAGLLFIGLGFALFFLN